MKFVIKIVSSICIILIIMMQNNYAQPGVTVTTITIPPVSPYLNQAFTSNGSGVHVTIVSNEQTFITVYATLKRLSPTPFSISLNYSPNYDNGLKLSLNANQPVFLNYSLLAEAFANFTESPNLIFDGISLEQIQEGANYKLPEGYYNICFSAYYKDIRLSTGCANFYICDTKAPQFTQPVNNLIANENITIVQPASPVTFSWLPPQSSCGLPSSFTNYNFEIRELLDGQSITDAVNNPFVFRKTALPSNIFLLDTNLYQHVLEPGKKYIMQVQATTVGITSAPIENNGYSRIEAFQYGDGSAIASQFNIPGAEEFYIPFNERKTDYWDDALTAYLNHSGKDTLVPIKEYIGFALMETGIAYNLSSIELFLSLNPELANEKMVKLSYTPKLPVFPDITNDEKQKFEREHSSDLQTDTAEQQKFLQHLNELIVVNQHLADSLAKPVNDLIVYLNNFKAQLNIINHVSLSLTNEVLSELLFELRNTQASAKTGYNKLITLITSVKDLTAINSTGASLFNQKNSVNNLLLTSSVANNIFHYASNNNFERNNFYTTTGFKNFTTQPDQLLPFNIIVWHNSKDKPYRPVTNAPDLTQTYRISYTLSALYNYKNPEIKSHASNDLASTIQLSLPAKPIFKFWTRYMPTGKITSAEDVDMNDILVNSIKRWPNPKKPTIVLKVE